MKAISEKVKYLPIYIYKIGRGILQKDIPHFKTGLLPVSGVHS